MIRQQYIQEYAEDFIRFLETESILAPESSQEMYVRYIMAEYYKGMVRQIQNRITERLQPETLPTSDELPTVQWSKYGR